MRHVHYSRFIFSVTCPRALGSVIPVYQETWASEKHPVALPRIRTYAGTCGVPSLDRVHYVSCWCEVNKFTREKRWTAERSAASAQSHPA